MQRWPRRTVLASLVATGTLTLFGTNRIHALGSTPAAGSPVATPGAALLPRDIILPLNAVQQVVPEMAKESATGANQTTVGNPTGTRAVTFATADGAQRVVISVDQYRTAGDASATFQEAFRKSQAVPGAKVEAVSDLGEAGLIGVATQGNETHVGGGAQFGDLIVTVTLQGYEGTDTNKARVAELIRRQAEHAEKALQPVATPSV
jgi:hypothetical protein